MACLGCPPPGGARRLRRLRAGGPSQIGRYAALRALREGLRWPSIEQVGHAQEVVCGGHEVPGKLRALRACVSGAAEVSRRLYLAEDLFDALANPLADRVAAVASREKRIRSRERRGA